MKKTSLLLIVMLLCAFSYTNAQSKLSGLTRSFLAERNDTIQKASCRFKSLYAVKTIRGEEYVSVFIQFNDAIDRALLESYGIEIKNVFDDLATVTATAPADVLETLSKEPAIKYIEIGRPVDVQMDLAKVSSRVDSVQAGAAPLTMPYKGDGVVIGIIDKGLQYDHINFVDAEGKLRVKRVLNQNTDISYETEDDIRRAKYDLESYELGHGTHVAGIAAGSDSLNGKKYYGVAPSSEIVMVSFNGSADVDLVDAIQYVFDYALEGRKPCVVNLSLGSNLGPHDGSTTFDKLTDSMQGRGRIIVGASGNEGADSLHVSKKINSEDSLCTFFDFPHPDYPYGTASIWGEAGKDFYVQVAVYKEGEGIVYTSDKFSAAETNRHVINNPVPNYVRYLIIQLTTGIDANNNKPNVYLTTTHNPNFAKGCHVGFIITSKDDVTVHAWADNKYSVFSNFGIEGWQNGDSNCSTNEIGGVATRMISVGAYVTRLREEKPEYAGLKLNDLGNFSGKGPTADGRVKPDITAPGAVIISSVPNTKAVLGYCDIADSNSVDGVTYYYAYKKGTSMSTPYVTGVIATWMQADPNLSPESAREVFKNTSIIDEYTGSSLPNNRFGYGKINAYKGLLYVLEHPTDVTSVPTVEVEESVMIYPNPSIDGNFNVGFLKTDSDVRVNIYSLNGMLIFSSELGDVHAGFEYHVSLPNAEPGVYIMKVDGLIGSRTLKLMITK